MGVLLLVVGAVACSAPLASRSHVEAPSREAPTSPRGDRGSVDEPERVAHVEAREERDALIVRGVVAPRVEVRGVLCVADLAETVAARGGTAGAGVRVVVGGGGVEGDRCEFFKGEEKPDVRDVHDNGAGVPAAAGGSVDGDSVHAQPAERQLTIVSSSTVGYFTVRFDGVEAHNLSYSDVLGIVASLALPKKRISLEELGGKRIPQVAFSGY